ncbi:hypothetical protein C8R45DRAFT_209423 [Mycena sanguinolenta]|nr:hypothetical protein C8R45DRAFT_209423 [Mycena sanguinolenta]
MDFRDLTVYLLTISSSRRSATAAVGFMIAYLHHSFVFPNGQAARRASLESQLPWLIFLTLSTYFSSWTRVSMTWRNLRRVSGRTVSDHCECQCRTRETRKLGPRVTQRHTYGRRRTSRPRASGRIFKVNTAPASTTSDITYQRGLDSAIAAVC